MSRLGVGCGRDAGSEDGDTPFSLAPHAKPHYNPLPCEHVPSKGGEFVREKTDMLAEGAGRRSVARGQAAAGTAAAL